MNFKINKKNFLTCFVSIVLVFLGLKYNSAFIYLLFGVLCIDSISNKKNKMKICMLSICVLSIILPDNYVSEFLFLLYFVIEMINDGRKIKVSRYTFFLCCFFSVAVLSTIINFVMLPNLVMAIISFAPFVALMVLIGKKNDSVLFSLLSREIDIVLFIELISIPFNYIFRGGIYGDDWSCGTFLTGSGQQAQLFVISAFLLIYYCYSYAISRNRKNIVKVLFAAIIMLSTNCITLVVFFAIGIVVTLSLNISVKRTVLVLAIVLSAPLLVTTLIKMLPSSMIESAIKIVTEPGYLEYRVHKIITYKETFIELPQNDIVFGIVGNGIGNYNSRAALMCTGEYVSFYNKLFSPSMSDYTKQNIYYYVKLAHDFGEGDYGSVLARPYSSIMALMGETGYLGLILFLFLIKEICKNENIYYKLLILVWLSFCLVENYFEYPKVLIILFICLSLSRNLFYTKISLLHRTKIN